MWEYEQWVEECLDIGFCFSEVVGYERWTVDGDSAVEAQTYQVLRQDDYDLEGEVEFTQRDLVRFDTARAMGVLRLGDGSEVAWPSEELPCRLDAPFEAKIECEKGFGTVFTDTPEEITVRVGGETETRVVKWYQSFAPGSRFTADVGLLYEGWAEFGGAWIQLSYARVGEIEYGTEQFPVSAEEEAPPEAAMALWVFPNPAAGEATVRLGLDAPQRVSLAVFDVLGRRVLAEDLGYTAGEVQHRLGAAQLPAGVYVVRLAGDAGATATARFVRQ